MNHQNKSPDTVGAMKGLNTTQTTHSNVFTSNRNKNFISTTHPVPLTPSLTFIALDKTSFQIVQHFKGHCLLMDKNPEHFNLDFCLGKEIWLLYVHRHLLFRAMQFGRLLQWKGAAKVMLILFDAALVKEVMHGE
jgi:hypothetical protein